MSAQFLPDALLLLSTHCPHCASVMKSLGEMVKQGDIASLEVVNLEKKPELAQELGVRTVPWVRIGWFELEGLHSLNELREKAKQAGSDDGALAYISEELKEGRVNKVISVLDRQHDLMNFILELLDDAEAKINIRLGIGVIMEEYANASWFVPYISKLAKYSGHEDARVRADVCHYLSLTEHSEALPHIKALLEDTSKEVREVAEESLEELRDAGVQQEQ